MDPTYQQAMIQALMGQGQAAPGTTGQNATTPYGQGFMTGNTMNPANSSSPYGMGNSQQQHGSPMNSLTSGPSTQLTQPFSTY